MENTQAGMVLQHIKDHGECTNRQIKAATGIPIPHINYALSYLKNRGQVTSKDSSRGAVCKKWRIDESLRRREVMQMPFVPSQMKPV